MTDQIHTLLHFWFGDPGMADLPTSDRTDLWFGENEVVKKQLEEKFLDLYQSATAGKFDDWAETARGRLALIILYDQFSRHLYKLKPEAYFHDKKAYDLCVSGIDEKMDHALTLIERVFFYMPLVHAENSDAQERSIRLYQELSQLSMTETAQVYQLFLAYAYAHFRVIKEFGRFPQRNQVINRPSTPEEIAFLNKT